MNDQALRFRFGVFVLISLILLGVLTILFGGFPSYLKRTDDYTIIFDTAQGVARGTPVKRSGVRIGEVRSVKLNDVNGKVEIGIRIEAERHQRRRHHQSCAVRPGHQKGPQQQPGEACAHPDPRPVPRAIKRMVQRPEDQNDPRQPAQRLAIDDEPEQHDRGGDSRDRQRMADRDRDQRQQHDGTAAAV